MEDAPKRIVEARPFAPVLYSSSGLTFCEGMLLGATGFACKRTSFILIGQAREAIAEANANKQAEGMHLDHRQLHVIFTQTLLMGR